MTATTTELPPTTIKTWATVGEDGVLKLDLAPGYYEVVLVRTEKKPFIPHPSWPPGFLERRPDRAEDPAFKRYPQPPLEDVPPLGQG